MAIIRGTTANDQLRGTASADSIFGLGGSDRVLAKGGNDLVDGGAVADDLFGELGDDRLFGDDGGDALTGGVGRDRVFGGTGEDFLSDRANGPDGNDIYDGGAGRDTVSFADQAVGVNLTLAEGAAEGRAVQGGEVDLVRAIEGVIGSTAADVVFGNSAANFIDGSAGSDRIYGRGGNDIISSAGRTGADVLLDGGGGNDTIASGLGQIRSLGGTGADFIYAGFESPGRASDVDRADLGRDAARDTFNASLSFDQDGYSEAFGVERVSNVGAPDRFNLNYSQPGDIFLTAGDYLDSDGNGLVNDSDRDARLVNGDLLLDIDQLFERVANPPTDLGTQHVILEDIARIDADQFI